MDYYSTMRRKSVLPFVATWVGLEGIVQSKISQTEKGRNCVTLLICESEKPDS